MERTYLPVLLLLGFVAMNAALILAHLPPDPAPAADRR